MSHVYLAKVLEAYIACALWSSNDESDESGGEPINKDHGPTDLSMACLARMGRDCETFLASNNDTIANATFLGKGDKWAQVGHDFWLTRNRHGCGFWDGDWSEPHAKTLTDASHAFGEVNLMVGDDGSIQHA